MPHEIWFQASGSNPPDHFFTLVLDDLHWADGSTLRLLRHVSRAGRLRRALVLVAYRDDETRAGDALAGVLGDLGREAGLERIQLVGFDDAEAAALNAASGIVLDPGVASRLLEVTAGNPFFLGRRCARWRRAPDAALHEVVLGPAVKDMIARRLARLGPRAAEVLSTRRCSGRRSGSTSLRSWRRSAIRSWRCSRTAPPRSSSSRSRTGSRSRTRWSAMRCSPR